MKPTTRLAVIALVLLAFVFSAQAAAARPNIIVMLADDVGYSDIGCFGGEIQTPNLDRLAGGGVRFTQFYNTARCCPTRASRLERMKAMGLIDPQWKPAAMKGDWASVLNKAWEARCMEVYAAQLDSLDQGVGKVVAELQRSGAMDNTLIFYMQDNGGCAENIGRDRPAKALTRGEAQSNAFVFTNHRTPHVRDGRPYRLGPEAMPGPEDTYISYGESWANVSDTPFREYKHWVHEGGISTPLIAHWPRGIDRSRQGKLETQPGHLIDIMATCVDVSGATYPTNARGNAIKPMEGTSLAPAFKGKSLARKQPIFWEHEGNRAVRDGDWKLVAKENRPWEIYNLKADRTEQNDLVSSEPERVKAMTAQWDAYAARANVLPLGAWRDSVSNTNRTFVLKAGAHLDKAAAPLLARQPFTITARFDKLGKDGVIVAQGATAHGYALFVEGGRMKFALRRANTLTVLDGGAVEAGERTAKVFVRPGGELELTLDNKQVANGKAAGLLTQNPVDGLDVGSDEGKPVADYKAPNPFGGRIDSVEIVLGP